MPSSPPLPSALPSWGFLFLPSLLPVTLSTHRVSQLAHLLHRQLLQFGEGAGEQANQEGGGAADDVNHGGGEDRNEGVLPGEGVEQSHHSMGAAGEGAGRQTETELLSPEPALSGNGS